MKAVIDIGSNSILLSIADVENSKLKLIIDDCRVCGLVKKLDKDGRVSTESLEKAQAALRDYRKKIDEFKVDSLHVLATESLRRPSNGEEVRSLLEKEIQSPIEIISGEREAELSFWSVQKEIGSSEGFNLIFDIGGASTELVLGNHSGILVSESLRIGSVVLTEKHELDSPSLPDFAIREVDEILQSSKVRKYFQDQGSFNSLGRATGIGVAGTMTTLIAIDQKLREFSREQVHAQKISFDRTKELCRKILHQPLVERSKVIGLPENRADVFSGGLCILLSLMKAFHWNEVFCYDAGIRIGKLYEDFAL